MNEAYQRQRNHAALSEQEIDALKKMPISEVAKGANYSEYRLRMAISGHPLRKKTLARIQEFLTKRKGKRNRQ